VTQKRWKPALIVVLTSPERNTGGEVEEGGQEQVDNLIPDPEHRYSPLHPEGDENPYPKPEEELSWKTMFKSTFGSCASYRPSVLSFS
jgi:hypothetical protein